jgi:hypothetical protein
MTEADYLAELQTLAPELHTVALLGPDGDVRASTLDDPSAFAAAAAELLDAAASVRPGGERTVERLHVEAGGGAVFAVAGGGLTLVAAAGPEAAPALALHDLRACLTKIGRDA